jgi:glycosyltransferase involved in cell wall biosynthesis
MLARRRDTGRLGTVRHPTVALDAHTVGRKQTGNERYVVELGNALATRADVDLVAYLDRDQLWPSDAGPAPTIRHLRFRQPQLRIPIELPIRARRDGADLLHVAYVAPPVAGVRLVTAVHDVSFEDMPGVLPLSTSLRLRLMVRLAARRSAAVVTGSEFTRGRLIELFGLDPDRVHAVPYGVGSRWRPLSAGERDARLTSRRLPARFALFVGAPSPRKNLGRLIDAVAALRGADFADLELVVAGPVLGRAGGAAVVGALARNEASRWVHFLDYVSDDELHALYCRADVVAYPSLYEGFGFPVLEALACGAAVVASSTTAVPEVAGDAALLVDPADANAIRDGLARVLSDDELRRQLQLAGPARAARFTWAACAAGTVDVYRRALAG